MIRSRIRHSLTAKLLLAQLLVIVAGSVTLALVASAIAPDVFHDHVGQALGVVPVDVARHLDRAFRAALLVALSVAIGAAVLTSLAVSVFVSGRIARPIRVLAEAAERVARGTYTARVPATGSDELAALGGAFNEMAAALESAEGKRRALLTDVAHELRTPLATVEGYVEGLADGVVAARPGHLGTAAGRDGSPAPSRRRPGQGLARRGAPVRPAADTPGPRRSRPDRRGPRQPARQTRSATPPPEAESR